MSSNRSELESIVATAVEKAVATAVEKAVEKAIIDVLIRLGIDASDPLRAQRDFAAISETRKLIDDQDFKADLSYLRKWRLLSEKVYITGVVTICGLIISGLAAIIVGAVNFKK